MQTTYFNTLTNIPNAMLNILIFFIYKIII